MILHIMVIDKFLAPFIDFVDKFFGREGHKYVFITSEKYLFDLRPEHNVEFLHTDFDIFCTLLGYMKSSKKIILHGLWRDKVDKLLLDNHELLKKSYWVMWGADFYFKELQTGNRCRVIKDVGFLVNGNSYDISLVREQYGASGQHVNCLTYPTSIFEFPKRNRVREDNGIINILLGNSSTKTNNHMESLDIISGYKDFDISIYCPLSYGDKSYGEAVMEKGFSIFGEKFKPMVNFLERDEYLNFLSEIDIALFNNNRQQGFANMLFLLGSGAKLFLSDSSNLYHYFKYQGFTVFDVCDFNLELANKVDISNNAKTARKLYSREALVSSLRSLFEMEC